jgi:hypothetical protein
MSSRSPCPAWSTTSRPGWSRREHGQDRVERGGAAQRASGDQRALGAGQYRVGELTGGGGFEAQRFEADGQPPLRVPVGAPAERALAARKQAPEGEPFLLAKLAW